MAVLGQILAGRSREVMGGYSRLREVTGGYGGGKRRKVEERQEKGLKKTKEYEGKSLKAAGKRRKMEELRSSTESSVRWGSEQDSLQGDEKWYWGRRGRRVAKQGEVFQRCCRWFGLLFTRDWKRTFGVITSIIAATTTFLCGNKKIRAKGWLSSPLLRCMQCVPSSLVTFVLGMAPTLTLQDPWLTAW